MPNYAEIEAIYDKAHVAVQIVRLYNPSFIENISTIANLASGAYGLYNSGENTKTFPPEYEQRLIHWGRIDKNNLGNVPSKVLKQYFPDFDERRIKKGDTIHVNVKRILSQSRSNYDAILQIASTIIHEATHEIERETKGTTYETGPQGEEQKFKHWAEQNMERLYKMFPELQS